MKKAIIGKILVLTLITTTAFANNAEIDCNKLINQLRNTGAIPEVTIDTEWVIVRIKSTGNYCREPVEEWKLRTLSWPVNKGIYSEAPTLHSPSPSLAHHDKVSDKVGKKFAVKPQASHKREQHTVKTSVENSVAIHKPQNELTNETINAPISLPVTEERVEGIYFSISEKVSAENEREVEEISIDPNLSEIVKKRMMNHEEDVDNVKVNTKQDSESIVSPALLLWIGIPCLLISIIFLFLLHPKRKEQREEGVCNG